jgi:hypothetical protein
MMRVLAFVMVLTGCGGVPFETLRAVVAEDSGQQSDPPTDASRAETSISPVGSDAAAADTAPDPPETSTPPPDSPEAASPDSGLDAATGDGFVCSTDFTPAQTCYGTFMSPAFFSVNWVASKSCDAHTTPSECAACTQLYACACILAALPGVCGGELPSCAESAGMVTVDCP